jgi:hypothetical protein
MGWNETIQQMFDNKENRMTINKDSGGYQRASKGNVLENGYRTS